MPAAVRAVKTPRRLAQRRPRDLLERRGARARPRAEHRHPLGRRAGLLAARRIDLGPGDAGAAGRHQSPGDDHDHAAPRWRSSKRILAEPTTVQTTDSTFANQAQLPREFIAQIVSLYENTRLGRQEIYAEFLETTEGVWFASFDPARHVSSRRRVPSRLLRPLRHRRRHVAAHRGGVFPGSLRYWLTTGRA